MVRSSWASCWFSTMCNAGGSVPGTHQTFPSQFGLSVVTAASPKKPIKKSVPQGPRRGLESGQSGFGGEPHFMILAQPLLVFSWQRSPHSCQKVVLHHLCTASISTPGHSTCKASSRLVTVCVISPQYWRHLTCSGVNTRLLGGLLPSFTSRKVGTP